ncbi:MAG: protein-glutamate O-methyltransferase CheR [Gammaproteobacteria bacterium]|nr:protein-glutamate O-methyltransferase CheR [Gammaproteobacteria bacterium]
MPEYKAIRDFIYLEAGIDLGEKKQMLVSSRLTKRLRHYQLNSFKAYMQLINSAEHKLERQMATDLLTTNETYFFREPEHFKFLKKNILENHPSGTPFRLWSAASSSGEEAYTISMVLDDYFGARTPWEILGSDISSRIIEKAQNALYPTLRIDGIPQPFLKKYCLKGMGEFDGFLMVHQNLRSKCSFRQINLINPLPDIGKFDVIFLRNVLIYFDAKTKEKIVRQLVTTLKPDGVLFIGHSESLKGMDLGIKLIAPTTYQKI